MITPYIETDCTVTHEGALVTHDRAIGYPGWITDANGRKTLAICDWHGAVLGSARITATWRISSYMGDRMYQVTATIDGVNYTGRSMGHGMSWRGKRTADQGRAIRPHARNPLAGDGLPSRFARF